MSRRKSYKPIKKLAIEKKIHNITNSLYFSLLTQFFNVREGEREVKRVSSNKKITLYAKAMFYLKLVCVTFNRKNQICDSVFSQ